MQLQDKVAIITGGGGPGTGRAVAIRLAREGAAVVLGEIDRGRGEETLKLIQGQGGRAALLPTDVSIESQVRELFALAEATFGGVDVLVNNASAPYRPESPLEYWYEPVLVDLLGAMHATKLAIPALRKRGGGAIVNFGSTSALGHGRKHSKLPTYDVAKAGVTRLTTTLAWLAAQDNIRVNCLVPDWVATPEVKEYWDPLAPEERRAAGAPDELTSLDDIANAVVRLATDESLAGRVWVWWNGQPAQFIADGDVGYEHLE